MNKRTNYTCTPSDTTI